MFRWLFRVLAMVALAVAVIMAVIDATRSIAASALTFTPLGESWYSVSPDTLNLSQAVVQRYTSPVLWDPVAIFILTLPGWLVFAALSLLFYAIGRPGRRTVSLA
ncbi:hypothetical protein [Nitratireductor pacificus]|uniref:Uncharacterized protein n=1 Tax=Nitratireductor pacificus pht-3B TaxID=391937 RepID=K2MGY2_9HYPH|nr:hypothetical protein [Nitratireductor pacificus]EKF19965.1 hypothetical protein NA2_04216 [Nitratireductor pacificus pht-3B]